MKRTMLLGMAIMGAWGTASARAQSQDALVAQAETDPAQAMRRIAAMPFRYGGELQGTVPAVTVAVDQPPVHLSLGLSAPAADGTLRGEAILFTTPDRRLVAIAPVAGRIGPGSTPGTAPCQLRVTLPRQVVALAGVCTADSLSGEIVTKPGHVPFFARLVTWWDDRAVAGRYWLTPASFDPLPFRQIGGFGTSS